MSDFQKKLFSQIGVMLGVVAVLGGGILFFGGNISAYTTKIASVRTELVRWASSLQSFVSIKSQYKTKAKQDIDVLNNIVPQQDRLIDLRKEFQFLASASDLDVGFSFTGERDTASAHLGAIGISLTLQGDTEKIVGFLQKLSGFQYLVSIRSVTIEEKDKTTVGTVRGEVFFRK